MSLPQNPAKHLLHCFVHSTYILSDTQLTNEDRRTEWMRHTQTSGKRNDPYTIIILLFMLDLDEVYIQPETLNSCNFLLAMPTAFPIRILNMRPGLNARLGMHIQLATSSHIHTHLHLIDFNRYTLHISHTLTISPILQCNHLQHTSQCT